MKTIRKHAINLEEYQSVWLPEGAEILNAESDGTHVFLLVLVDESKAQSCRYISMFAAGQDISHVNADVINHLCYIGNFNIDEWPHQRQYFVFVEALGDES